MRARVNIVGRRINDKEKKRWRDKINNNIIPLVSNRIYVVSKIVI
jgi:hypothetical protein